MAEPNGARDEGGEPEDVSDGFDGQGGIWREDLAEVCWCKDCIREGEEECEC